MKKVPKLPTKETTSDSASGSVKRETSQRSIKKPFENKEIPVAARFKGPGPAAYILPTTLGSGGNSKGLRSPSYSFGMKLKLPTDNQCISPGPNTFFPTTTRNGISKGPAFSLKGSHKKKEGGKGGINIWDTFGLDTPGPGKYFPKNDALITPRAPAYSISARKKVETPDDIPGPALYEISPTIGMHTGITIPSVPAYSIKPLRPLKLEHVSPGPAAYQYDPKQTKKSAPKYSLASRIGDGIANLTLGPTPAPGQYSPKIDQVRGQIPHFSFRCKHSEYELFVPDNANEEFSF